MEIDGYKAVIQFDPDIDMFRGEFIGLNGGADFYARDIAGLRKEGAASLKVFLEMCEEDGVEPRRWYSGKFNLRISPELHVISAADPARKETSRTLDRWTGPNDSLASLWANPANCSFWPFNGTARSPGLGCTEMKLRPFQRAFIRGATAPGIDTAALSTPRGQGKSWLAAYLLARVLYAIRRSVPAGHGVGSLCRDFGAGQWIVFRFLRATLEDRGGYSFTDSANRIS